MEVTALQGEMVPNSCYKGELWSRILLMGREGEYPAQEEFTALLAYTTVNTKI